MELSLSLDTEVGAGNDLAPISGVLFQKRREVSWGAAARNLTEVPHLQTEVRSRGDVLHDGGQARDDVRRRPGAREQAVPRIERCTETGFLQCPHFGKLLHALAGRDRQRTQ